MSILCVIVLVIGVFNVIGYIDTHVPIIPFTKNSKLNVFIFIFICASAVLVLFYGDTILSTGKHYDKYSVDGFSNIVSKEVCTETRLDFDDCVTVHSVKITEEDLKKLLQGE